MRIVFMPKTHLQLCLRLQTIRRIGRRATREAMAQRAQHQVTIHKMMVPQERRRLPQEQHQLGPIKFLQDTSLQPLAPFYQAKILQDPINPSV